MLHRHPGELQWQLVSLNGARAAAGIAADPGSLVLSSLVQAWWAGKGQCIWRAVGGLGPDASPVTATNWTGGGFSLGNHFYSNAVCSAAYGRGGACDARGMTEWRLLASLPPHLTRQSPAPFACAEVPD